MRANPLSRSFTQCMIHFTTYWLAMYYSMYRTTIKYSHYLQNTATTLQQNLVQAFHQPSLKLSVFPYFMVSPKFTRNTLTSQPYNQLFHRHPPSSHPQLHSSIISSKSWSAPTLTTSILHSPSHYKIYMFQMIHYW